MWKSDRADLAAGLRISERLRHEPLEQAKKEQDEAVELGGRLFWQPSFPLPISKRFDIGTVTEPVCSENAVHPHHPARIKLRLEQTIPGCDWLIGSFGDLLERLYGDELWLSGDSFNQEIADADAAEAPGRLAFELGPEGDRYRRYGLSAERLVIKRFGDFLTTRGKSADGTFDPVDVDLQSLLGTAAPVANARAEEAQSAGAPPHPACGRPLPEGRGEEEEDRVFPRTFPTGTADRPGLELPGSSPYEEISCADEHFLRNEAIAHRGDLRNEASADGGEQETDATMASRFDETEFGHSRRSPLSAERSAREGDRAEGSLVANLDLERRRREFEKQSQFRAKRPEKPSERARREAEEAEAALHALSGLGMSASSPCEEISCDDEDFLRNEAIAHRGDPRNEAIAHCGDPRNEASADGGEQETDATTASRSDETDFGRSRHSPGNLEPSAPARDRVEGSIEAKLAIGQIGRELEMQAPFRASTPGKPSERDRREMDEAVAAYHFAVRRAAEQGRRAQDDREHGEQIEGREARTRDAEGKENGARKTADLDTS